MNGDCTSNKGVPWLTNQRPAVITWLTQRQSLLGMWNVGEDSLPTLHRQSLRSGRHSLNCHAWDTTTTIGTVAAVIPSLTGAPLRVWEVFWHPCSIQKSRIQFLLLAFLCIPSPRTDHCCFAKAISLSIWSPILKRASRPQQFSKLQWLPLLTVKKQLLKPTDKRIFKLNI